ncbi:hypothetical protein BDN72DRAFT_845607, partial [Pluteus cervinus]
MQDPCFPLELEQIIFTYAVQTRIRNPTNLFLVAKRVREWLVPIVFEVIIIQNNRSFPIPFTPLSKFQEYRSHLRCFLLSRVLQGDLPPVTDPDNSLEPFLRQCHNITNLALWWYQPTLHLKSLTNLSELTHLSIDGDHLLDLLRGIDPSHNTTATPTSTLTLTPVLFPGVTHLDLLGARWASQCDDNLTTLAYHFPNLTHIAHPHSFWAEADPTLLELTLRKFNFLRVLVWWKPAINKVLAVDEYMSVPVCDERIVAMRSSWEKDWEREARRRGDGLWSLADRTLKERKERKRTAGVA